MLVRETRNEDFEVLKTLAMRVLSVNEYAERARVVFTARVISEENAEFKGYRRVLVSATLNRSGVRELVSSASTVAVVVYSCALRVSEQIYSKPHLSQLELHHYTPRHPYHVEFPTLLALSVISVLLF